MTVTTYAPGKRIHHHGRPKREDAGKLVRTIVSRLTLAEHAKLMRLARARGINITHAVRAAVLTELECAPELGGSS